MPELHVAAGPGAFAQAADHLGAALDAAGVHGRTRYQVELIFEEVVTNILRHGQLAKTDSGIDVQVACETDAIRLTFTDGGRPFDLRQQPPPRRAESLEDAPLGGLGIALVRHAARDLQYVRTPDGRNQLTVTIARD